MLEQFFLYTVKCKNSKFQTIQFSAIWHIDVILSGATIPVQSGPGTDNSKEELFIPESFSITVASPLDCLLS